MRAEVVRSSLWGVALTALVAALIVIGSRNLAHFDAALVGYTFATLFATFGITYRYTMWLQRPPTRMYWRRGWQTFLSRRHLLQNLAVWPKRVVTDVAATTFIRKRGFLRWAAHFLIMWGCIAAAAITFPLVFGWLYFQAVPGAEEIYRVFIFGFPTFTFPVDSAFAVLMFHGLVWSAFPVIAGVMLAMRRRMRDVGAWAAQDFFEDFLPLILLFAVSVTGLLLTASYTWMQGYAYQFLALFHAVTVIFTLLWLPFGKFFHIFQRPAQLGVRFYKAVGAQDEAAKCRRCGHPFSSRMHVEDLIEVERALGYRYEIEDGQTGHYQWICPRCRRAMLALAQGRMIAGAAPRREGPMPMPRYVNPGPGEGPLGDEDADNFHP